jgi:hypothetical protein
VAGHRTGEIPDLMEVMIMGSGLQHNNVVTGFGEFDRNDDASGAASDDTHIGAKACSVKRGSIE